MEHLYFPKIGILAASAGVLKNGENGKGLLSRWYPQTIARRLSDIALVADRMSFIHGDAFEVLKAHRESAGTVFFIDPPYTAGGKSAGSRLYTHSEIDHDLLFSVCEKLKGDFLMTYDNADEVAALAHKHGFETKAVPMKNTHHAEMTELLIGRDLSWVADGGVFRDKPSTKEELIAVAVVPKKRRMRYKISPSPNAVRSSKRPAR